MLQRWQKEERARGKGLHRTCSEGRGALTGASGAAGTASAPPGLSAAAAGSSASPTMARGVARPQQKRIWPAHDCRQGSEWGRLTARRPSGSSQGFRAAGPLHRSRHSLVFLARPRFLFFFLRVNEKAASSRLLYVVAAAPRRALVALANSHDQRLHAVISFASAARTLI